MSSASGAFVFAYPQKFLKKLLLLTSGSAVPFFLTHEVVLLLLRAFVCWQILAALDFLGLRLPLKQRYDVTRKPFLQTSLFSPVLWQPWINILSWTDPTARKYLLTCRERPLFFSDCLQQQGSACSQPPMMLLPVFSICWTFTLYLFHLYFSSITEPFHLTILLVQFLPLCNFTWMLAILSRIYFYRSFALCCFPLVSLVYSGQGK